MSMSQGPLASWALVSRVRYALVWGGLNVFVFLSLTILFGSVSVQRALLMAIPVAVITCLVQAWIWYPRQKRQAAQRGSTRV